MNLSEVNLWRIGIFNKSASFFENIMINNLFYNQIYLLTGNKLDIDPADPPISISKKYYSLFDNKYREKISLNDVANLVNNNLSRKEEYGNTTLDKWGRFDHDKSFLVKNKLDQSPIIDELILDVVKQLNLKVKSIWPEGKKAAICLTHDVDAIDGFSYFWLRKFNWYWRWFKAKLEGNQQEANNWISTLKKMIRLKNNTT